MFLYDSVTAWCQAIFTPWDSRALHLYNKNYCMHSTPPCCYAVCWILHYSTPIRAQRKDQYSFFTCVLTSRRATKCVCGARFISWLSGRLVAVHPIALPISRIWSVVRMVFGGELSCSGGCKFWTRSLPQSLQYLKTSVPALQSRITATVTKQGTGDGR